MREASISAGFPSHGLQGRSTGLIPIAEPRGSCVIIGPGACWTVSRRGEKPGGSSRRRDAILVAKHDPNIKLHRCHVSVVPKLLTAPFNSIIELMRVSVS